MFTKVNTFAIPCKEIGQEQSKFFKEIDNF